MSKAEDLAAKLVIPKQVDDIVELCKFYYIAGYQQAEKDNELTCQDIKKIYRLVNEVSDDLGIKAMYVNIYQEVLKRFKERKEN